MMGLSCSCYDDFEPGQVLWYGPEHYTTFPVRRRTRCCSCNELIGIGAVCAEVPRYRVPKTDIEVRIYGEDGEIPAATKYMCERCADLAFSLEDLGFCAKPWEDQRELVAQYADMKASERKVA